MGHASDPGPASPYLGGSFLGEPVSVPIHSYGVCSGFSLFRGWYCLTLGPRRTDTLPPETLANATVLQGAQRGRDSRRVLYYVTNPGEFQIVRRDLALWRGWLGRLRRVPRRFPRIGRVPCGSERFRSGPWSTSPPAEPRIGSHADSCRLLPLSAVPFGKSAPPYGAPEWLKKARSRSHLPEGTLPMAPEFARVDAASCSITCWMSTRGLAARARPRRSTNRSLGGGAAAPRSLFWVRKTMPFAVTVFLTFTFAYACLLFSSR